MAWTTEDYDREIKRLESERAQKLTEDPEQRKQRRIRRTQILGDYAAEAFSWSEELLDAIRKVAARTDEGWLFEMPLLESDGWTRDTKGWRASKSG